MLVKIVRADAQTFGFTSADKTLTYSSLDYEPTDGLTSSAFQGSTGSGVDNLDVFGALTSARITEADLRAGKWDGARITVYAMHLEDPSAGVMTLSSGIIGEVEVENGRFTAEVRSLAQHLKQAVIDLTTKTCRARRLGDARCKVSLAGDKGGVAIQATRTLSSGSGSSLVFGSDSAPTGHYSHGIVKMLDGPNTGVEREVKSHTLNAGNAEITLRRPFPYAVTAGEDALLEAGCDRLFVTCDTEFGNANNFHGEHLLPGNDKVLQVGRAPDA